MRFEVHDICCPVRHRIERGTLSFAGRTQLELEAEDEQIVGLS